MVKRLTWLIVCAMALTLAIASGYVLGSLAWRGLWVEACGEDVGMKKA